MDKDKIIEQYNATDVVVSNDFIGWLRSDHAGETGAVWIYKGASLAFWSKNIRKMALEHGETEKQHLVVMNHLLPDKEKSRLIFLWSIFSITFSLMISPRSFKFITNPVSSLGTPFTVTKRSKLCPCQFLLLHFPKTSSFLADDQSSLLSLCAALNVSRRIM